MTDAPSVRGNHADRIVARVTEGGLRNSYVSLAKYLSFFPEDSIGAPNVADGEGNLLTLHFAGLPGPVLTDISATGTSVGVASSGRSLTCIIWPMAISL